jgi:ABC-type lipoprotein export system ATPase subunit
MGGSWMDELVVLAQDVRRVYGAGGRSVVAVEGATFSVPAGRRIAIVGPSGSGKSTLLHLMAGIDLPTSGVMSWPAIGGREVLRPGPIAVAFQGPSLLPALTVTENVALPLLLEGHDETSAVAAAATCLDLFDLREVADKLPEEISGGQSQRAGLARALVNEPRLVLVDEPTGQLDRETAARTILALLDAVVAGGAALVVATHDLDVAERMEASWRMDSGELRIEETRCSA